MANLKNTTIDDTGFLQLPSGTTAQRPTSPANGQMRFNTTLGHVEWYDATYTAWFPAGFIPPTATGGTVTNITQGGVDYRVHTFTTVGTGTFTVTRAGLVEFLIVAGGGGGASRHGGGGGAGGLLTGTTTVQAQAYTIIVGGGGGGAASGGSSIGVSGTNSTALGFTTIGGGFGSSDSSALSGGQGGSGGGARGNSTVPGGSGTPGQGNNGGNGTLQVPENFGLGGGGGGASTPGFSANQSLRGFGGTGIPSNISGTMLFYAGGGGAGGSEPPAEVARGGAGGGGNGNTGTGDNATAGAANTGGGGAGGGHSGGTNWVGRPGGSGIVIIRYRTS